MKKNNKNNNEKNNSENIDKIENLETSQNDESAELVDKVENSEDVEVIESNIESDDDIKIPETKPKKKKENRHSIVSKKSMKYGSISIAVIAIVIAMIVVLNFLATKLDTQLGIKWDLSKTKMYSISDTTKKLLKNMNETITIYVLLDYSQLKNISEKQVQVINELLTQYENTSKNIKIVYKDPIKNPSLIQDLDKNEALKLAQPGDFVITMGSPKSDNYKVKYLSQRELLGSDEVTGEQTINVEQKLSGAIKYVLAKENPSIYVLEGHGELKVDTDLTIIKTNIQDSEFKSLNLLTEQKIPEMCEMLFIPGPKSDLSEDELATIKAYMDNGGKMILTFDTYQTLPKMPNFEALIADYQLKLGNDKIKEPSAGKHLGNDEYLLISSIDSGAPFYQEFVQATQNEVVLIQNAMSITTLLNKKENIKVNPLIKTSELAISQSISDSQAQDKKGTFNLGYSVENNLSTKPSKLVVIGDTDFMKDTIIKRSAGNFYLFAYLTNWLIEKKQEINIDPKRLESSELTLTGKQITLFQILYVVVIPIIIFGIGITVYFRRRHL